MAGHEEKTPRVSVVIPCFNGERFVRGAVESVLSQTYRELEVVVVDDGSSDGSRAVVRDLMSDPRVNLVTHDSNRGIPSARNSGVAASRGEYVAFLDQDDEWVPEKLERQVPLLDEGPAELGLVFSDVLMVDDGGRNLGLAQGREIPSGLDRMSTKERLRALFLHNFVSLISVLVRRRCLDEVGGFDETITGGMDDYELCLRLFARFGARCTREPLAMHRVHDANYSSDTERLTSDALGIMGRALAAHPELTDLMARKLAIHHLRLARYHRDAGRAAAARAECRRSIAADRTWVKAYVSLALCSVGPLGRGLLGARRGLRRPRD